VFFFLTFYWTTIIMCSPLHMYILVLAPYVAYKSFPYSRLLRIQMQQFTLINSRKYLSRRSSLNVPRVLISGVWMTKIIKVIEFLIRSITIVIFLFDKTTHTALENRTIRFRNSTLANGAPRHCTAHAIPGPDLHTAIVTLTSRKQYSHLFDMDIKPIYTL